MAFSLYSSSRKLIDFFYNRAELVSRASFVKAPQPSILKIVRHAKGQLSRIESKSCNLFFLRIQLWMPTSPDVLPSSKTSNRTKSRCLRQLLTPFKPFSRLAGRMAISKFLSNGLTNPNLTSLLPMVESVRIGRFRTSSSGITGLDSQRQISSPF